MTVLSSYHSFRSVLISLCAIDIIVKNFTDMENLTNSPEHQNASGVINQYKDIIRDQDYKLQNLQMAAKKYEEEIENLKKQMTEMQQTNAQLFDQNILLKAQLAAATNSHQSLNNNSHSSTSGHHTTNNHLNNNNNLVSTATETEFYKAENRRLEQEVNDLNGKLNEALEMTEQSLHLTEIGKIRKDQEDLLCLLSEQVCNLYFVAICKYIQNVLFILIYWNFFGCRRIKLRNIDNSSLDWDKRLRTMKTAMMKRTINDA